MVRTAGVASLLALLLVLTLSSGVHAGGGSCSQWTMADCVQAVDRPWEHWPADSEQRTSLWLYASPRDLAFGTGLRTAWPTGLNATAIDELSQIAALLRSLGRIGPDDTLYAECWPLRDDWGQLTFAFARYATSYQPGQPLEQWIWFDGGEISGLTSGLTSPFAPNPFFVSSNATDFGAVFDDFLEVYAAWHVLPHPRGPRLFLTHMLAVLCCCAVAVAVVLSDG